MVITHPEEENIPVGLIPPADRMCFNSHQMSLPVRVMK